MFKLLLAALTINALALPQAQAQQLIIIEPPQQQQATVSGGVDQVLGGLHDIGSGTVHGVKDGTHKFLHATGLDRAASEIHQGIHNVNQGVVTTVKGVGHGIGNAASSVVRGTENAVVATGNGIKDGAQVVGGGVIAAKDGFKNTIKNEGRAIANVGRGLGHTFTGFINDNRNLGAPQSV